MMNSAVISLPLMYVFMGVILVAGLLQVATGPDNQGSVGMILFFTA